MRKFYQNIRRRNNRVKVSLNGRKINARLDSINKTKERFHNICCAPSKLQLSAYMYVLGNITAIGFYNN